MNSSCCISTPQFGYFSCRYLFSYPTLGTLLYILRLLTLRFGGFDGCFWTKNLFCRSAPAWPLSCPEREMISLPAGPWTIHSHLDGCMWALPASSCLSLASSLWVWAGSEGRSYWRLGIACTFDSHCNVDNCIVSSTSSSLRKIWTTWVGVEFQVLVHFGKRRWALFMMSKICCTK